MISTKRITTGVYQCYVDGAKVPFLVTRNDNDSTWMLEHEQAGLPPITEGGTKKYVLSRLSRKLAS